MNQKFCPIAEIIIIQYNMKQGLNRLRQSGVGAIKKEVRELVTMVNLEPDNPKEITREDFRAMMAYLVFLKEIWDGNIKARGCFNGRVQRNYMKNQDTSSPTAMQESLMVTCIIDVMEGRNVAIAYIPVAFLQTDMAHCDFTVHVKLCGVLVYLLVNIDP